jgi:transposase InsO family protein
MSEKLKKWAGKHGVTIQHIQPVHPQQNAYIERYNRTVRHGWLDQHIIESIEEALDHATQWLVSCSIWHLRYEGTAARHIIYGGQRRWLDRKWPGRVRADWSTLQGLLGDVQ